MNTNSTTGARVRLMVIAALAGSQAAFGGNPAPSGLQARRLAQNRQLVQRAALSSAALTAKSGLKGSDSLKTLANRAAAPSRLPAVSASGAVAKAARPNVPAVFAAPSASSIRKIVGNYSVPSVARNLPAVSRASSFKGADSLQSIAGRLATSSPRLDSFSRNALAKTSFDNLASFNRYASQFGTSLTGDTFHQALLDRQLKSFDAYKAWDNRLTTRGIATLASAADLGATFLTPGYGLAYSTMKCALFPDIENGASFVADAGLYVLSESPNAGTRAAAEEIDRYWTYWNRATASCDLINNGMSYLMAWNQPMTVEGPIALMTDDGWTQSSTEGYFSQTFTPAPGTSLFTTPGVGTTVTTYDYTTYTSSGYGSSLSSISIPTISVPTFSTISTPSFSF